MVYLRESWLDLTSEAETMVQELGLKNNLFQMKCTKEILINS